MHPKEGAEQPELAILTATAFDQRRIREEEPVVTTFSTRFCHHEAPTIGKKRTYVRSINREQLDSEPARPGEQVAAKVLNTGENGSWILANVLDYDPAQQAYELQDEDDVNRVIYLGFAEVKRLEETAHLHKGDDVLAVFPETTSFYRASVAKNVRPPQHGNSGWDVVVRFEDDEDESGRAPPRRVPGRFVLRRSDIGDHDDVAPPPQHQHY